MSERLQFVDLDYRNLSDWLHDRHLDMKTERYGEPIKAMFLVQTDEMMQVYSYGFDGLTEKLRFIDESRRLSKHGNPIEGV